MITQMLLAGGGPPPVVNFIDSNDQPANAASYTWADQATGATKGHLIIGIFSQGGSAGLTGLTFNGVAAPSPLVLINNTTVTMGLYVVPMPVTGLITVVGNFGASKNNWKAAMWRVENLASMAARDTDFYPDSTGQPSTTVNIPKDGFAISMAARTSNTGSIPQFSWTNATPDFEIASESQLSGATTEGLSGNTTITATWAGGAAGNKVMVTASLR